MNKWVNDPSFTLSRNKKQTNSRQETWQDLENIGNALGLGFN